MPARAEICSALKGVSERRERICLRTVSFRSGGAIGSFSGPVMEPLLPPGPRSPAGKKISAGCDADPFHCIVAGRGHFSDRTTHNLEECPWRVPAPGRGGDPPPPGGG